MVLRRLVLSSCVVVSSVRLVLFSSVAVRFAAARRCLLVMPSRWSVVRIVICLISRLIVIGQGGSVRVFLRRLVDTPVVSWSVAVGLVASDGGYGFASAVLGVFRAFLCLCIPCRLIVPLCGEGVLLVSAWRCGVHSSRRGRV